jgi:hypothetical protein
MIQRARAYRNIKFLLDAEVVRWEGAQAPAPLAGGEVGARARGPARGGMELVGVTVRRKGVDGLQTVRVAFFIFRCDQSMYIYVN